MNKTAVVIGATGLIGAQLLEKLLRDERYQDVWVLARRSTGIEHPKLKEKIGDLLDDAFWKFEIAVDDVFCCIGTTQAKTSDMQLYKSIDYGVPLQVAHWGLKNGMQKYLVISSMGANKKSRIFYSRIKGQMEDALRKMAIPRLYLLRPSLLLGNRNEFRMGEALGKFFTRVFSPLIPAKYKGIQAETVASAMINLANSTADSVVYESDELRSLGSES